MSGASGQLLPIREPSQKVERFLVSCWARRLKMDRARLVLVSLFAFLFAVYVPKARADQWNQATKISINHAMEIPGRVLDPGTYWFTVMRDNPQRNVEQVWNADRQHLLATILTVPDYRVEPTGKTVIKFSERP